MQYQASVDGRYLTNLYDSYSKRNQVFVVSQDGENPMDQSYIKDKYNIGIDKQHTVFATVQFIIILLRNGDKVAVFFDKEPQIGRFGSANTFILTKAAK